MLIKEPKGKNVAPCMVLFCAFEQQFEFIELGKKYGLKHYINLVFRKNFSVQVLKANMKVPLLERIIEIFTDKGDVVIDPCAGSGTTLLAAANMKRKAYGFEVNKKFCADAEQKVLKRIQHNLFV